jgi:hypothetical protein
MKADAVEKMLMELATTTIALAAPAATAVAAPVAAPMASTPTATETGIFARYLNKQP